MSRLDVRIASRYLRSRRSSRLVSMITIIATGGVTVGVMALIVVMGVMNGLQNELRQKILVASPHLRVLTFGRGLRLDGWEAVRDTVLLHPDVVAVAPFVDSKGLIRAGADFVDGVYVLGIEPNTGTAAATPLAEHFVSGDLSFRTTLPDVDGGIVLGVRVAERLSAWEGERITMVSPGGTRFSATMGTFVPKLWTFEVVGRFETGMYEYDNVPGVGLGSVRARGPPAGRAGRPESRSRVGGAPWLPVSCARLAEPEPVAVRRTPAGEAGDGNHPPAHRHRCRLQHREHPHDARA